MKLKKIKLIIIIVFAAISINAQNNYNYTKKKAWQVVQKEILKNNTQNVNVFVSESAINANKQIKTMYKDVSSPSFTSWFFFIDENPFQSWGHACKYVFVDVYSGKIIVKNEKFPPEMKTMVPLIKKKITKKGSLFNFDKNTSMAFETTDNNYAVIISGGHDAYNNWVRYWNDCAAIYSALVNIYGYQDDHIYVLMSDGTNPANDRHHYDYSYDSSPLDLDDDGDDDIQYAATKANITTVFNTLQGVLSDEDNLFVYTTDHGGQESGTDAIMYLWGETIRDDEFATEINKANVAKINIVMEQCYSGGFVDDLSDNNRVIATACRYDEVSWAMPPDYTYDEFVYHWTAAVAGETPSGDPIDADDNNDCYISMEEAFDYAEANDTRSETPQYDSQPVSFGYQLSLDGFIQLILENITIGIGTTKTYQALHSIIAAGSGTYFIVEGNGSTGGNATFNAGDTITLKPGFHARLGSSFHASIQNYNCIIEETEGASYPAKTLAGIEKNESNDLPIPVTDNRIKLYPNPTTGMLTVELSGFSEELISIEITNLVGSLIYKEEGPQERLINIDLSGQPNGIYFVKTRVGNRVYANKIIKQ